MVEKVTDWDAGPGSTCAQQSGFPPRGSMSLTLARGCSTRSDSTGPPKTGETVVSSAVGPLFSSTCTSWVNDATHDFRRDLCGSQEWDQRNTRDDCACDVFGAPRTRAPQCPLATVRGTRWPEPTRRPGEERLAGWTAVVHHRMRPWGSCGRCRSASLTGPRRSCPRPGHRGWGSHSPSSPPSPMPCALRRGTVARCLWGWDGNSVCGSPRRPPPLCRESRAGALGVPTLPVASRRTHAGTARL